MSSTRQLKYGGLIQKDLGELFQRDPKHWFGGAFITVTGVDVTPDLALARVHLSLMMVKDQDAFLASIREIKSEIRKVLGQKIGKQVRVVPDLVFYLDKTQEEAQKMDAIISKLDIPKSPDEES